MLEGWNRLAEQGRLYFCLIASSRCSNQLDTGNYNLAYFDSVHWGWNSRHWCHALPTEPLFIAGKHVGAGYRKKKKKNTTLHWVKGSKMPVFVVQTPPIGWMGRVGERQWAREWIVLRSKVTGATQWACWVMRAASLSGAPAAAWRDVFLHLLWLCGTGAEAVWGESDTIVRVRVSHGCDNSANSLQGGGRGRGRGRGGGGAERVETPTSAALRWSAPRPAAPALQPSSAWCSRSRPCLCWHMTHATKTSACSGMNARALQFHSTCLKKI